jgi:hypothetical protein
LEREQALATGRDLGGLCCRGHIWPSLRRKLARRCCLRAPPCRI